MSKHFFISAHPRTGISLLFFISLHIVLATHLAWHFLLQQALLFFFTHIRGGGFLQAGNEWDETF